jgi:hypothetical protein
LGQDGYNHTKGKFLPVDYSLNLCKKLMLNEYTKELYKLCIRSPQSKEGEEVLARYINGLGHAIQDELSISDP